jgi:AraC-like DNA-binding protein
MHPDHRQPAAAALPQRAQLKRLASLLAMHAPIDGRFDVQGFGVSAIRLSSKVPELLHAVQHPALCIVAQGAKRVFLGQGVYDYDASHMLIFSVDLPVAGEVLRATPTEPYLCFMLELNHLKIAELLPKVFTSGPPELTPDEAFFLGQANGPMVESAANLLELLQAPAPDGLLAQQLIEDILLRLLRSSVGSRVAQIGAPESGLHRVGKAITWLRCNFRQPMNVDELAKLVHMSVSSFHQHFKSVTAMSPLQFQKALRLQEARRIMLADAVAAAEASRHVGYSSASQFSREFARFFGSPPIKHVERLRDGAGQVTRPAALPKSRRHAASS